MLVIDGQSDGPDHPHGQPLRRGVHDRRPRCCRTRARITAAGLNIGLEAARGDVIVRVDGHASVDPDFLSRSVEALYDTRADCVGGVIESEGDTDLGERSRWRCRRASASAARRSASAARARSRPSPSPPTAARSSTASAASRRTSTRVRTTSSTTACVDSGGTIMLVPGITRPIHRPRRPARALAPVRRLRTRQAARPPPPPRPGSPPPVRPRRPRRRPRRLDARRHPRPTGAVQGDHRAV